MVKQSVLVVEDEKNIQELVKYNLEKEGFRVTAVSRGDEGLRVAKKITPDLILLDLMLPEMDGLDVCKALKQIPRLANIPIIMLTARSDEVDKVLGLELGADDYVTKPFSPRELLARVKAVLRRQGREETPAVILRSGTIELDAEKHIVSLSGQNVQLTSKEFALLKTLMESRGRVLSREVLLEQVWGLDRAMNIETRTVDMHVGQLRKKLKNEASRILTVKNAGYRFDGDDS